MKYRDDREALRSRAEVLESDLEAAERRLREAEAKLEAHREKDEREQQELEALRREVERLRPAKRAAPERSPKAVAVVAAAAVVVTVAGAAVFVAARGSDEAVVVQSAPAPSAAPAAPPTVRQGDAIFGGLVVATKGDPVEAGTPCLVHARLRSTTSGIGVENLVVRCGGGATLYDASTPIASGMQSRSGGALELTGTTDQQHYLVDFALTGQWQGDRPQIELSSDAQRARVWRSGLEESSTTLHLDDLSFPRGGASLDETLDALQPGARDRRPLALTAKEGAAPEALADCELRVHPAPERAKAGGRTCRVIVQCGGTVLYGGKSQGWNACSDAADGVAVADPTRSDGDGDPALTIDGGTVTLADGAGEKAWKATFRIEPSPCLKKGSWRAHAFGDRPRTGTLDVAGREAQLQWEGDDAEMLVVGGCDGDVVTLTEAGGVVYSLAVGPRFASAGGTSSTGEVVGLLFER